MKTRKKIQLNRETLRFLDGDQLSRVAGATVQQTNCGSNCNSNCTWICSCKVTC
jgi:hypothetical protein